MDERARRPRPSRRRRRARRPRRRGRRAPRPRRRGRRRARSRRRDRPRASGPRPQARAETAGCRGPSRRAGARARARDERRSTPRRAARAPRAAAPRIAARAIAARDGSWSTRTPRSRRPRPEPLAFGGPRAAPSLFHCVDHPWAIGEITVEPSRPLRPTRIETLAAMRRAARIRHEVLGSLARALRRPARAAVRRGLAKRGLHARAGSRRRARRHD